MSASTVTKAVAQRSALFDGLAQHGITVPDAEGAASYLDNHHQLEQLLPGICGRIRKALGPEADLSLELYQDPECDDRYLTLYVRREHYEPDFLDRLHAISEEFNHQIDSVPGYLLLTTDFSRPRGGNAV